MTQIALDDGRRLGYAFHGPPDGKPVFYFHGFPGSRFDWLLFNDDEILKDIGIRLIAVDRPGYGLSDSRPGRTLLDWPDEVTTLADALQIDRFAVLGISGGGPFAASCAFKIPNLLTTVSIVSGMGPPTAPGMKEGLSWTLPGKPGLVRKIILMLTSLGVQRNPDQFLLESKVAMSETDRRLLDEPESAKAFIDGLQEAFRSGIHGADQDAAIYARPWGFRLQDITARVYLWHGGQDKNVPISVGTHVTDAIQTCQGTFLKDEGHLSLARSRMAEILRQLVS